MFTTRLEGQGLAEYGLILALVVVACIGAVGLFGETLLDYVTAAVGTVVDNIQ